MSWSQRVFAEMGSAPKPSFQSSREDRMKPGLTGQYDWALREKAGMRQPPPPPECMGLEGEYDKNGLAKRVAKAFDQDPDIGEIETLCILQNGSKICLMGKVSNTALLNRVIAVASQVDGTTEVDVSQVVIEE